jgi:hypothetical protein
VTRARGTRICSGLSDRSRGCGIRQAVGRSRRGAT